jgi:hypothetical protein
MDFNEYQLKPVMDSNGIAWAQRCYVCDKCIDFRKDPSGYKWLRVDYLVRHRKCRLVLK